MPPPFRNSTTEIFRCMPKRPSSITLTPNDKNILVADKFGDVYSLPLLWEPAEEVAVTPEPKDEPKKFAPSANVLTVHSGRNRKALEEQLKQAQKGPKHVKEAPKFKRDLILGHVSMLTDVASIAVGSRSYILTADRDEHIRVSRGLPQAHIIEGFCQGHDQFVSRLCFTQAGKLVSGGGDEHIYLWDWLENRLLKKLPLLEPILEHFKGDAQFAEFKAAVSGIWRVPNSKAEVRPRCLSRIAGTDTSQDDEILVACEGLPALVSYKLDSSAGTAQVIPLSGNVLDLAFVDTAEVGLLTVVSIDNIHERGSTSSARASPVSHHQSLLHVC